MTSSPSQIFFKYPRRQKACPFSLFNQDTLLREDPLFICVTSSILAVWIVGYMNEINYSFSEFIFWYLSQITAFQFYNPGFMRNFGVGVLNGSLWTICVELQFYLLVPIIYLILRIQKVRPGSRALVWLIVIFLIFNVVYNWMRFSYGDELWFKLIGVSFVPWFYMFLVGVFVQRNFVLFYKFLHNRFITFLPMYGLMAFLANKVLGLSLGNAMTPFLFLPLALLTFSLAFSHQQAAEIFKRNDISYGIYIYHMPIINMMLYMGYCGSVFFVGIAILLTVLLAVSSWTWIEKPALKLKKHSLRTVDQYGFG